MSCPPPPPPPHLTSNTSRVESSDGRSLLLDSIRGGTKLKKTEVNDRSAPTVQGGGVIDETKSQKKSCPPPPKPRPPQPPVKQPLSQSNQDINREDGPSRQSVGPKPPSDFACPPIKARKHPPIISRGSPPPFGQTTSPSPVVRAQSMRLPKSGSEELGQKLDQQPPPPPRACRSNVGTPRARQAIRPPSSRPPPPPNKAAVPPSHPPPPPPVSTPPTPPHRAPPPPPPPTNRLNGGPPPPPSRNSSMRNCLENKAQADDLDQRFGHLFHPIESLPYPEIFIGFPKSYPSKIGSVKRQPAPQPPVQLQVPQKMWNASTAT